MATPAYVQIRVCHISCSSQDPQSDLIFWDVLTIREKIKGKGPEFLVNISKQGDQCNNYSMRSYSKYIENQVQTWSEMILTPTKV